MKIPLPTALETSTQPAVKAPTRAAAMLPCSDMDYRSLRIAFAAPLLLASLLATGCDAEPPPGPAAVERYTCNICGETSPFRAVKERTGALCPVCMSKERHRLLFHYLEHSTTILQDELDVLHFSPNPGLADRLRAQSNLNYVTADLYGPADLKIDLTDIDQPDASWDVLICYHILEHIIEDRKAISEMFRILRPGGLAIIQVPLEPKRAETYEDASIVDPEARLRAFGQSDHVRRYGVEDFRRRLEAAGFEVEAVDHLVTLDPDMIEASRLKGRFATPRDERIWIARKPDAR